MISPYLEEMIMKKNIVKESLENYVAELRVEIKRFRRKQDFKIT